MVEIYKDWLTERFPILIQTIVLQALRQAFGHRFRWKDCSSPSFSSVLLMGNKVHEQDGSVVKTPTLPAPTSRSAVDEGVGGSGGAASMQPMGFTPNGAPQMGYPMGVPGQPVYGSA